jgi:integrase
LIEQQSERIKVCYAPSGSRRQAVTTQLAWAPSSATKITTLIGELRDRMESLSLGLADAYQLLAQVPTEAAGQLDWSEVAARYERWRVSSGCKQSTYDREERSRIAKVLQLLALPKRAPHDGRSLMSAYAQQFLAEIAPGAAGRKRNLLDVARFLSFAVTRCGAYQQWMSPGPGEVELLIGARENPNTDTIPIRPEQLFGLLESLDEQPDLRLAVGLVGLYGLRPSELMALQVVDGQLRVGNVKRNKATAKNPKPPRLVLPLDLKEMPGEGTRVLQLYSSGLVKLPTSIFNAKDFKSCGAYFRQYLDRHPFWQSLVAATPGLTPYGLRHGYAWRGARYYDRAIPLRDLADLMGHDLRTHQKHYGRWTTDEDKRESVMRAVGSLIAC